MARGSRVGKTREQISAQEILQVSDFVEVFHYSVKFLRGVYVPK